ncbi:MAG: signal peptidase I [Treponema sp.]|nr:signal peptidase I [Treponema sp.]
MNRKIFQYSYSLKKEKQKHFFLILLNVAVCIAAVCLILKFLVFPVRHNSSAMLPDFEPQSLIMVTPLSKTPQRGDVVLVRQKSDEELPFFKSLARKICIFFTAQQIDFNKKSYYPGTNEHLRRVLALPGDTIYMKDYVLYVKPEGQTHFLTEFEICEKKYNVLFYIPPSEWETSLGVQGSFSQITLKENEYFVLGDNRKSCEDSRLWGPVMQDEISAKAMVCYFPFNRIKLY